MVAGLGRQEYDGSWTMGAPPNVKKGAAQTGARGVVTDGAESSGRGHCRARCCV